MAIQIDELANLLSQEGVDKDTYNKLIKAAEELENEKKEEREENKTAKSKYKYTICVRGGSQLKEVLSQGWIVKTPLDQDDNSLEERFGLAIGKHNAACKRKKTFIETFADFFEFCKRKFTKEYDVSVQIVTKEPVRVLVIENELPQRS